MQKKKQKRIENKRAIPRKDKTMIKIESKYKKDIKSIFIYADYYHIVCEYRCKKTGKHIEYFLKIEKATPFYYHAKNKENDYCNCLYFDFNYNFSLPARIDDVLNIKEISCYYANNSDYDNANDIRNETIIVRTKNKVEFFSHKLHYPNFNPREINHTFSYWHRDYSKNNADYVKIYTENKGE